MLTALGWTLAGLAAVVLCAVVLPIGVRLSARTGPRPRLRVEVRFLAGLTPWLSVIDTDRPRTRAHPRGAPPKRRSRRTPGSRVPRSRVLGAVPGLLRGLVKVLRLRRLRLEGRYGLGDPAETGALHGYLSALAPALRSVVPGALSVRLEPDFERARLDGEAEAELGIRLVMVVPPALRFAWAVYGPAR